jgi:hypothetical protein
MLGWQVAHSRLFLHPFHNHIGYPIHAVTPGPPWVGIHPWGG